MKVLIQYIFVLFAIASPFHLWGQPFPYPAVPDTIVDSNARATYLAEHFWDDATMGDTALFSHPKVLMDYLYLLKQQNKDKQRNCAKSFIASAVKQADTFAHILYWLDNILYDATSPLYDEELNLVMMQEVVVSDVDTVMKLIPAQRLEIMQKNRIGHPANDFLYIDKSQVLHRLYDIEAPLILLMFNNPECSLCQHTQTLINEDKYIQALASSECLKIVAIATDSEQGEWLRHPYPPNWLTGYDASRMIFTQRLYDIQRLPCIYLLDKDKNVLLKEADYDGVRRFLTSHANE